MDKEFVPYQPSLDLKELGFDEPCFGFWTNTPKYKGDNIQLCITDGMHGYSPNSISFKQDFLREGEVLAPLYQQAFRWFREKYKLTFYVEKPYHHNSDWRYVIDVNENEWLEESFKTYEEAELECLVKLIEIVKQNNNE
jgi:hypothetical protein